MNERKTSVKLHFAPKLRRPYLVASWSGMGAVALLATNYLRQQLDAELFGGFDPHDFYSPSQVLIQDGIIQALELPETKFYFWNKGQEHDLIIFVGTDQPSNAYEMALQVLDAAEQFAVERIYTAAAMPTFIHHSQEPSVWCTATHPDLVDEAKAYGVTVMDHGTIGGLNGLLLAVARDRNIDGLCLLGEIPIYATQMINPQASRAVLAVLTRMLNVEIDLGKLTLWAEDLRSQMDRLYSILPDQVQEAIEKQVGSAAAFTLASLKADETLVADEAFFEQIERFLQEHAREDDEGESDEDQEA